MTEKLVETDVLVIGGGGAAGRAAIEAAKSGLKCVLVDKGRFGKSGSTIASAGTLSAPFGNLEPKDSPEIFFKNIVERGGYMNDQNLVELLVNEVKKRVLDLDAYGFTMKRTDGKIKQFHEPGHTYARGCAGYGGGISMMKTLRDEAIRQGTKVVENVMITRLITDRRAVTGAIGLDVKRGELIIFKAKGVILATGSATGLFPHASASMTTTGDGFAIAYQEGVPLINLEFVEFTLIPKFKGVFMHALGISNLMGLGAELYNRSGECFLKYDPMMTRARMVRACHKEIVEKREPISMDTSRITDWSMIPECDRKRFSMLGEMFEIVLGVHTFLGGIKVDKNCEVNLRGLFGAGEVVGGLQGAMRLSGNALGETQVLGAQAGKSAASRALRVPEGHISEEQIEEERARIFNQWKGREDPFQVEKKIQKIAGEAIGVTRSEDGLRRGISEIKDVISQEIPTMSSGSLKEIVKSLEVANMSLVAMLIMMSALKRRESRGMHFREDYPKSDENLLKHICIRTQDDRPTVSTIPIEVTRLQLPSAAKTSG